LWSAPSIISKFTVEAYDSRTDDELEIVLGEIQTLTVYYPTRISLADPRVVDIVKMEGKEMVLAGKNPGSTTLNIWDQYGQRTILIRVVAADLDRVKERLEQLLSNIKVDNLSLEISREEGKIVLRGDVLNTDKDKFNEILDPFRDKVINFINFNDENALVQIDVQILELSKSASDKLGIDWLKSKAITFTEKSSSVSANLLNLARVFQTDHWTRGAFDVTLNLLVSEGKGRVLSRPKLVVMSGKEASFLVGGQIPIISSTTTSGGNVSTNVEFKDYGVNLKVKPTVKKDERIDLTINTDVSSVDKGNSITSGGTTYFAYSTRTASTQVYLMDGETIFIAGLIKNDESENLGRLPAISKIPILGALFKSKDFSNNQTELVISLTPTILKEPEKKSEAKPKAGAEKASVAVKVSDIWTEETPTVTLKELPDYLVEYAGQVQDRIAQAAVYPEEARQLGWEGTVRLGLRILADGTLSEAKVKQSSGYEIFDDSAVAVAKKQTPYPGFPAELRSREISIEVPVVYSLNPSS